MSQDGTAPDSVCVFRAASLAEGKRAAQSLTDHGCHAEVDSELAPDAMVAADADGAVLGDYVYTVWVAAADGDAAAELLAGQGFESAVDPYEFVTTEKPWVVGMKKWLGRLIVLLLLAMLVHWLWLLLGS